MKEDRAMAFFDLIRLQAEVDAMAEELADVAEADLRAYEAVELEAKQRVSAIDPISVRQWG
jgi:hypothetical protein